MLIYALICHLPSDKKHKVIRRRVQLRNQAHKTLKDTAMLKSTDGIKFQNDTTKVVNKHLLCHSLYKLQAIPLYSDCVHNAIEIPADSIMFDRTEFERLNELYGPFTMDGAASLYDAVVPNFCSIERPFENENVQGQTVFLNPPFAKAQIMLQHFECQRQKSPLDTKALIVLPQ